MLDAIIIEKTIAFGYDLRDLVKGKIQATFTKEVWATKAKDGRVHLTIPCNDICMAFSPAEALDFADRLIAA